TTACATRKAITTSSTLVLANPANAFAGLTVLVRTTAPAASIVEVSNGKTPSSTDTIAVANTAKRCQAWSVRPAGPGASQMGGALTNGNARFNIRRRLFRAAGSASAFVATPALLMTAAIFRLILSAGYLRGLVPSDPGTGLERLHLRSR